jgi:MFS family permease
MRPLLQNRTFLAVSVSVGVAYTGVGMVSPVLVLYAQSRGASVAIIGAMASSFLLSNFVFQYPTGWIADRWGRKRVMVIGLAVEAALSLVYLVINNAELFIALRFVEGMVGAALLPPARALIAEVVPDERRGQAYGIFSSFFNAGYLVGPAVGGVLAVAGYGSVFVGSFAFRLAAAIIVAVWVHDATAAQRAASRHAPSLSRRALFTFPLLATYILAFGDYLWLGYDLTAFPLWMRHHIGASIPIIGLAIALWGAFTVTVSPFGGRIADRGPRWVWILVFGLAQLPIYAAYALITAIVPILALIALHGVLYSLMMPAVDATLAASSPVEARARAQSVYTGVGLGSALVAANVFSILYGLSFRLPFVVMGAGFGLCVLIGGSMIFLAEHRVTAPWQSDDLVTSETGRS